MSPMGKKYKSTHTRDDDYFSLPPESEIWNIEELHGALQCDDKEEDDQEPAEFKDYPKDLKQNRKN